MAPHARCERAKLAESQKLEIQYPHKYVPEGKSGQKGEFGPSRTLHERAKIAKVGNPVPASGSMPIANLALGVGVCCVVTCVPWGGCVAFPAQKDINSVR